MSLNQVNNKSDESNKENIHFSLKKYGKQIRH